jgi:hypothetical protein
MGKHEHETRCILIVSEESSAQERRRVEKRGGGVVIELLTRTNGKFVRLEFR